MRINDDLTKPVTVHSAKLDWIPSPAAGVDRRMLYRVGGEVARATTIVRYAPGSSFPRHVHSGGEEILVLEGNFQDEHGDYPAGCYFRYPAAIVHSLTRREYCRLLRWADLLQRLGKTKSSSVPPRLVSQASRLDRAGSMISN